MVMSTDDRYCREILVTKERRVTKEREVTQVKLEVQAE
jgi:hypothetical protein